MVNYGPTVDIRAPGTDDNGPRKKEGPIVDARPLNLAGRGDLCNVRPDLELIFNDGEFLARFRFQVGGKFAEHDALYAGGNSGIYPDLFGGEFWVWNRGDDSILTFEGGSQGRFAGKINLEGIGGSSSNILRIGPLDSGNRKASGSNDFQNVGAKVASGLEHMPLVRQKTFEIHLRQGVQRCGLRR